MKQRTDRRSHRLGLGKALTLSVITALVFGTSACSGGSSNGSSAVVSAVMIDTVTPDVGTKYGGTQITITGEGFSLGTIPSTVTVGGLLAADVTVIDDNTITATVPAGFGGITVGVAVQNTAGVGYKSDGFRYLVPPPITSDLNNDGIADLAVSAPLADIGGRNAGAVFVFFGSLGNQPDTMATNAAITVVGEAASGRFGTSVLTGDINGDGFDDLAVGATLDSSNGANNGAVYIFHGPLDAGIIGAMQADVVLTGETGHTGDQFGASLGLGDLDDNGTQDLVVGALREDARGMLTDAGAVYVWFDAGTLQSEAAEEANTKIVGIDAGDELGNMVAVADVNADGIDDLLAAAHLHDPPLPVPKRHDAGAVFVFLGGRIGDGVVTDADVADIRLTGEEPGDEFGMGLAAGDIDGDGIKDVMVGAPRNDGLGFDVGRVYLFHGGEDLANAYALDADALFSGQPSNDNFGESLTCGDTNGDGRDDMVVGAPRASHGAIRNGRSFVFLGSDTMGDAVASQADHIQTGEPVSHEAFGSCTKVADWNRDGMADMLVSAPGNDGNGPSSGRVYVFRGRQFAEDQDALTSDTMLTGDAPGSLLGTMIANGQ